MMKSVLKRFKKEEKGFTLIELLAVIVILGIIAAIAVPMISNIVSKSRDDADMATAKQIYDAARMYVVNEKNGDFSSVTSLAIKETIQANKYLEANVALPSNKEDITGGSVVFSNGVLTSVNITTANKSITCAGENVLKGKGKCSPASTTTTTTSGS
ncbi:prepilin-type N-terminal cleavage/methylation domain-containing protein [Paenibacillus mucilaginosus]|uniref:Uncharacterized protein n=1 Tax=Paenibacillus mucilaginosus (strain KNP414) TaxID=1036673 RepID=F8FN52_PAEMK|nr:prepilin-type N-terminal cleavage/methylation domain-containing protein [Paenibacillus mucilaginosus]AEI45722.1 hypothetical protein KNP414_07212 [Paenibacillus mucilaginosus KNP414]MCG7215091.1 prepilin-type N-terminal cleavage/methylation domain-containing protein [Paenibacillus mucilaginosus]WDM27109.1 prepilin-type N-terminal cleavage/methylation domain-containing protein [Paenibacillus mucilaginosus]